MDKRNLIFAIFILLSFIATPFVKAQTETENDSSAQSGTASSEAISSEAVSETRTSAFSSASTQEQTSEFSSADFSSDTEIPATSGQHTMNNTYPDFEFYITANRNPTYIQPQGGIACVTPAPSQFHRPHKYYRIFPLSEFGINEAFTVRAVSFAIEYSVARYVACQSVYVHLYYKSSPSPDFSSNDLIYIKNGSYALPDMRYQFWTVPITGTVPAGNTLVVVFETADGVPSRSITFLGANNVGETTPSYILSEACGLTTPVTYRSLGFNTSLVWHVSNDTDIKFPDYSTVCPCQPKSCSNYCGARPPCGLTSPSDVCWCDPLCKDPRYDDCCPDFQDFCSNLPNDTFGTQVLTNEFIGEEDSDSVPEAGVIAGALIGSLVAAGIVVVLIIAGVFWYRRYRVRQFKLSQAEHELAQRETTPM